MRCRQDFQEAEAVLSDLAGVSFPFCLALRQPCVLDPAAIALVPSRAGQKTISKLAEHAEVKARVRQLEAEQVLPVDPRPDRLSGLSITQALAELHQRDQGQPPGWAGRLALLGIEVGEVAILEDRPECIAQGEIGAAFGKGGASDAGGLFGHTW